MVRSRPTPTKYDIYIKLKKIKLIIVTFKTCTHVKKLVSVTTIFSMRYIIVWMQVLV